MYVFIYNIYNIYICIYMYIYVYICIYTYIYIYVYVYMKPKIILIYCIILAQLKVNLKISKLIIKVHSHTVLMKKKKSLQTHLACQLNLKKLVKFT